MADNVSITSGTGVTIASDDDGSAQHQWVKIEIGANGSFVPITTTNGLPVQILSLPAFAAGSAVAITSLPDLGLNSSIKITSLPDLGLNSSVKITSLPPLGAATVSVNNFTFVLSITNLASSPLTVSGTTIAITSLPDIGLGSSVKISSLPALAFGQTVSVTNGVIVSVSPFTISTTNAGVSYTTVYKYQIFTNTTAVPIWTPAVGKRWVMTDYHFNTSTVTTLTVQESGTAAYVDIMRFSFFQNGGAVSNLVTPIKAVQTNTPLIITLGNTTGTGLVCGYEEV